MARAISKNTARLSTLFVDPFLRAAFAAAEGDGLAPAFVEQDRPRDLDGGAVASAELLEA